MNKRDRIQLEELAVTSAQESQRTHPGLPLSRHVRVALSTYRAGFPPDTPEPAAWDEVERRRGVPLSSLASQILLGCLVVAAVSCLLGFIAGRYAA